MFTLSSHNSTKQAVQNSINVIRHAFDNDLTPYYALIICLWGTIFLEVWKRKKAVLAYYWDVDFYQEYEPDRPEFYGTKTRRDLITNEEILYYPLTRKILKYLTSVTVILFMVNYLILVENISRGRRGG